MVRSQELKAVQIKLNPAPFRARETGNKLITVARVERSVKFDSENILTRKVPSFEPCMLSLPSNELCTLAGLLIFREHTHRTHSTTEIANGGQVSKPSSFAAHRAVSLRIYAIQPSMWFNSDVNDKEAHHLSEDFEALTSQLCGG